MFEIVTFSWEKRSTLLHFCWFKCPFHQGWIFAKSSWGANHLPALPYVFSRWQVSRLCHASVYGGSRLSLGRQGDFFLCWSTFANTFAETKIWPIQIIQNATWFIESLVLHLSVQGCVDIQDGPTTENLQIQVLKTEAHSSPMCCLAKKNASGEDRKVMYQYFSMIYAEFCFSKNMFYLCFWGMTLRWARQALPGSSLWCLRYPIDLGLVLQRGTERGGHAETDRREDPVAQRLGAKECLDGWGDMGRYGEMAMGEGYGEKPIVFQKLEAAKNHCPVKLFEFERGKWLPWAEVCRWNWTAFNCTAKMVAAAAATAAVSPRAREGFVLKYYESRWLSRSDVLLNPEEFQ